MGAWAHERTFKICVTIFLHGFVRRKETLSVSLNALLLDAGNNYKLKISFFSHRRKNMMIFFSNKLRHLDKLSYEKVM